MAFVLTLQSAESALGLAFFALCKVLHCSLVYGGALPRGPEDPRTARSHTFSPPPPPLFPLWSSVLPYQDRIGGNGRCVPTDQMPGEVGIFISELLLFDAKM